MSKALRTACLARGRGLRWLAEWDGSPAVLELRVVAVQRHTRSAGSMADDSLRPVLDPLSAAVEHLVTPLSKKTSDPAYELALARRRSMVGAAGMEAEPEVPPAGKSTSKQGAKAAGRSKSAPSKSLPSTVIATPVQQAGGSLNAQRRASLTSATTPPTEQRPSSTHRTPSRTRDAGDDVAPAPLPPPISAVPVRLRQSRPSPNAAAAIRVGIRARAIQERIFSGETISYQASGSGLEAATVREPARFTILAFAYDGSRMTHGGEPIVVSIRGVSRARARITDHNNGTYSVEWKPTVSGRYNIMITVLGVALPGSPFQLIATTPEPYPMRCELRGKALSTVIARETHSFEISFKDKLGAVTHAVDLDVFVEPVLTGSPRSHSSLTSASNTDRDQPDQTSQTQKMSTPEPIVDAPPLALPISKRRNSLYLNRNSRSKLPLEGVGCSNETSDAASPVTPLPDADPAPTSSSHFEGADQEQTRHRRIRVKVGEKGLIVRASANRHSEIIGQLLPGAIVTVIEEKVSKNFVRGCVALDFMGKEDALGRKTECGSTFRSSSGDTFRANPTECTEFTTPSSTHRSAGGSTSRSMVSTRKQLVPSQGHRGISDLMQLGSYRSTANGVASSCAPPQHHWSTLPTPQPSDRALTDSSFGTTDRSGSSGSTSNHARSINSTLDRANPYGDSQTTSPALGANASRLLRSAPRTGADQLGVIPETDARTHTISEVETLGFTAGQLGYSVRGYGGPLPVEYPMDVSADVPFADNSVGSDNTIGGHKKVQELWAIRISTPLRSADPDRDPNSASARTLNSEENPPVAPFRAVDYIPSQAHSPRFQTPEARNAPDDGELTSAGGAHSPRTGWVTLVKDGLKLVSSRLKLDSSSRWQHQGMWQRRVGNNYKPGSGNHQEDGQLTPGRERKRLQLELQADPNSFAFGGIYPGTVYARGKLYDTHRVSFSIGIAGQYLLHVRLRNQAASLPGSPFMLTVAPGPAFALSTFLPPGLINGEVGRNITVKLATADQMGNACCDGGAKIVCTPDDGLHGFVKTSVTDCGDGTYTLTWVVTRTGEFKMNVSISGKQLPNSPAVVSVLSTDPLIAQSEISESAGLYEAVVGMKTSFMFRFRDTWDNYVTPTEDFRKTFKMGFCLLKEKEKLHPDKPFSADEVCEGIFLDDHASFEAKYVAKLPGHFDLHVYAFLNGNVNERFFLPGSPFPVVVGKNNRQEADKKDDQQDLSEMFMTAPMDYKIDVAIFEAAQRRWGECTIDAFASAATHLLPRYWAAKDEQAAEHTDALSDPLRWKQGERIWAHPMPWQLHDLSILLDKPERCAEVIVVAPYWPRNSGRAAPGEWFQHLNKLCDEKQRYAAGRLHKVADDAPARIEEWPLQLYHIPAREAAWLAAPPQAKLFDTKDCPEDNDGFAPQGEDNTFVW